ncbi:hypothetical protein AB4672_05125 [Bacillus paralicheniformis]|uniref:hypothetical protein n=1 Tax=Bacillus paralicheniformis TaxID=1648923 RepID=UPI00232C4677|nr:hypothetical protein [Bacillus paralicheniformis]
MIRLNERIRSNEKLSEGEIVIRFLPPVFAGIAVFLVTFYIEYSSKNLSLENKLILNVAAAIVGCILGMFIRKEINIKETD